jgi:hypothetical protein
MTRLRACWAVHSPVGFVVTPRMWTRGPLPPSPRGRTGAAAQSCRRGRSRSRAARTPAPAGRPPTRVATAGCRAETHAGEDPPNRTGADPVAQAEEFTLDAQGRDMSCVDQRRLGSRPRQARVHRRRAIYRSSTTSVEGSLGLPTRRSLARGPRSGRAAKRRTEAPGQRDGRRVAGTGRQRSNCRATGWNLDWPYARPPGHRWIRRQHRRARIARDGQVTVLWRANALLGRSRCCRGCHSFGWPGGPAVWRAGQRLGPVGVRSVRAAVVHAPRHYAPRRRVPRVRLVLLRRLLALVARRGQTFAH